jgi:peptidoglycan hydrolase-like protein with peptidoglycan-binding domain
LFEFGRNSFAARRSQAGKRSGAEYKLVLGYLDPVDKVSGLQGRLFNLGYYEGAINGLFDDKTKIALQIFQSSNELEVTGEIDEKTKGLLVKLMGE